MEDFLSQLAEYTSSWHWKAFQNRGIHWLQGDIATFFTELQEYHRIEVVQTNLTTVVVEGELCHCALVTFKRYDKPGVEYAP